MHMQTFLTDAGYWAVIVFAFVQACCIPISSEITFGFAGVLAYQGHLSLALVIILGTLAELAGSTASIFLGEGAFEKSSGGASRAGGSNQLRRPLCCRKNGKKSSNR